MAATADTGTRPRERERRMSVLWVLGEAKSGKSELGEAIFARLPGTKVYIGGLLPEDWSMS
jgi:adenosyl cobinamide kinase/adenosyl cobinamide phosphate guanylyltransferase